MECGSEYIFFKSTFKLCLYFMGFTCTWCTVEDYLTASIITRIIIRKTKNSSFKNEKSKKEVDVAITVSNKDIV